MRIDRLALVTVLGLALAGCERPAEPAEALAALEEAIRVGLRWDAGDGVEGSYLTLLDGVDNTVLRLACGGDPAAMTVRAERFTPVPSEERFSFGIDDEPFVFVAASERPGPGVEATGPIDEALLARLERANGIAASYGSQTLGPHLPPDPAQSARFASACRQASRGG